MVDDGLFPEILTVTRIFGPLRDDYLFVLPMLPVAAEEILVIRLVILVDFP